MSSLPSPHLMQALYILRIWRNAEVNSSDFSQDSVLWIRKNAEVHSSDFNSISVSEFWDRQRFPSSNFNADSSPSLDLIDNIALSHLTSSSYLCSSAFLCLTLFGSIFKSHTCAQPSVWTFPICFCNSLPYLTTRFACAVARPSVLAYLIYSLTYSTSSHIKWAYVIAYVLPSSLILHPLSVFMSKIDCAIARPSVLAYSAFSFKYILSFYTKTCISAFLFPGLPTWPLYVDAGYFCCTIYILAM